MSSLNDFKLIKIIGKGAFGIVILVHRLIDGQIYAMKQVKINQLSDKEKQNCLNEIRILASLCHKNIIGYKDAFFDENSKTLNIVMEYADNGDMSQKIKYNLKHGLLFRESIIWNYLIQTLEGLHYLHENNIIHRDLKSANIFLMKDGTIKIGDLNVSKITKIGMAYTQTGTPYYASPEIWLDKPYDFKSDVWSFGCILYELCQLKPPFRGTSLKNLCINIQRGLYEPIMKFYSDELRNIIDLMLRTDPNMRPSTGQILKSKIIVNKKKELKIGGQIDLYEQKKLIDTIKVPRNLKEINGNLPTNKYNKHQNIKMREEMMKEDEYETNKRLNGFLDEQDKNEIKNLYLNNNINNDINKEYNFEINKNLGNNGITNNNNHINNIPKNNYLINQLKIENNIINNNNYNNKYPLNNNNSDNNRINNIVRNNQKIIKKNSNNSNRNYYNNDLSSLNNKLSEINNKDDLISLNYNLIKNRKKIINNKFMRNMSDVEDNNNFIYRNNRAKLKLNQKPKNVDDYISQNINIYNNINKYYYKNYFDLLSVNDNKNNKNKNLNNKNSQNKYSNNNLLKNKINSDKSPTKYNYIFNNGNQFKNINQENKLNISSNNDQSKNSNNFKLLMNNNFNPNININIFNNKEEKKPNLNNVDYMDEFNNDINNIIKISPKKEKNNNIKPLLEINSLESSYKKEKDSWYLLNDISDSSNNNINQIKKKKGVIQKLKTDNNDYSNKKNKIEYNYKIKHSDTESLNSQIYKINQNKINYRNKNIQYNNKNKNTNNQRKIKSSKTPKLKTNKNNKAKNFMNNNQLSLQEDINDNYSNLLLNKNNNNNNKYNLYSENNLLNNNKINNNFKKPKLLLNLENYHPQVYKGLNNKYRNDNNKFMNIIPYPSSENRYDNLISNKLKSNGLNLDENINNNKSNNYKVRIIQKNKSDYVKNLNLNNNLTQLNENDDFIFNINNNYNNKSKEYTKQNNYIRKINNNGNVNQRRPVSSIVQRNIEKTNQNKKFQPSFNNQYNSNNHNKFIDSLDKINNLNNFYSNKNQILTEANNYNNNIRLNNLNYLQNNNDLMNYRNKVKKNKLEIINNFNNYKEKIKSDYRKIDISNNNLEKIRNINNYNNQRVITPSPDVYYKKKFDEKEKITDKYKLKKLNRNIRLSKSNFDDLNESISNIQNNQLNNIDKIEVKIHPKKKTKIIIEKLDYQPIKKQKLNNKQNLNKNINKYSNYINEYNNNLYNNKIFDNYNINNNIYNINDNYLKNNDLNENKNENDINFINYNDYKMNKRKNINIINNIYGQNNKQNNFMMEERLKYYRNNNKKNLNDNICYSVGNNENSNTYLNYLKYGFIV